MNIVRRCHVCECVITDGEPYEADDWGWVHPVCHLQVEL